MKNQFLKLLPFYLLALIIIFSQFYYFKFDKTMTNLLFSTLALAVVLISNIFVICKNTNSSNPDSSHGLGTSSGHMDTILNNFSQSINKLMFSSRELSKQNNEIVKSSEAQSDASSNCISAIVQTETMAKKNMDLTEQSREQVIKVGTSAKDGNVTIQNLASSMKEIRDSNQELQNISAIVQKISEKTKVINEIVFQTKLLSFNASVEAARAGEHGKGFAVVAEEIGSLASMSGNAATEINTILNEGQERIDGIIQITNDRVTEGEKCTQDAVAIFEDINANISVVNERFSSIRDAAKEQNIGIEQASKSMFELDNLIQVNQLATNKSADHVRKLAALGKDTDNYLKGLVTMIKGRSIGHEIKTLINLAGRQRMLTQKMSKEAALVAAGINIQMNRSGLEGTAQLFDKTLRGLIKGDLDMDLHPVHTPQIDQQLNEVSNLWQDFRNIIDTIAGGDHSHEILEKLGSANIILLKKMNGIVKLYEDYSRDILASENTDEAMGVTLNLAGAQRMLSQKIYKELLFIIQDVNRQENINGLESSLDTFEHTLNGLKVGDSSLGLEECKEPEILESLADITQTWSTFKAFVNKGKTRKLTNDDHTKLSQLNMKLLSETNHVVELFMFWSV